MNMTILAVFCFIASIGCYSTVRVWIWYSYKRGVMDVPNERSAHEHPTPTSGGIGIALIALTFFMGSLLITSPSDLPFFTFYVALGVLWTVIGFYDDQIGLAVSLRLALQFVVAIAVIAVIGVISEVYIPYIGIVYLPVVLSGFILTIWIVGFINMFNFMDGIDGIAATQATIASFGWIILLFTQREWELLALSSFIASSCIGFLYLNWSPAKIFMGDAGSLFLGFTLAIYPIFVYNQTHEARILVTGVLFVFPFVFDATITILRRMMRKENVLNPHFTHLYQRLARRRNHSYVTTLYSMLAMASIGGGLIYFFSPYDHILFVSILTITSIHLGLMIYVSYIERNNEFQE